MTEMFEWDELWSREIPEAEFDRLVNTDWLREVKAEGDALKKFVEDARETVRQGLLQADAPLWFLRTLQRELGVPEEERA